LKLLRERKDDVAGYAPPPALLTEVDMSAMPFRGEVWGLGDLPADSLEMDFCIGGLPVGVLTPMAASATDVFATDFPSPDAGFTSSTFHLGGVPPSPFRNLLIKVKMSSFSDSASLFCFATSLARSFKALLRTAPCSNNHPTTCMSRLLIASCNCVEPLQLMGLSSCVSSPLAKR